MKMICEQCGNEIEDGDDYAVIDLTNHCVHEWCVDDYWDDLQNANTFYKVKGKEN